MLYGANCIDATLPRKAAKARFMVLVPETDTGGQVEHTKALERMTLKELGNLPP